MNIKSVMAIFLCLVNINNGAMEKENNKRKEIMERYNETKATGDYVFIQNKWISRVSLRKIVQYGQKKKEIFENLNNSVEILERKVIDYQTFHCDDLMDTGQWAPALKVLKLIPHDEYDGTFIYENLEKIVICTIDKRGKYGWADTPESVQKSPLYTIAHILVSKVQQHFLTLKDEKQRALLRTKNTTLLISLMNEFYWYYDKRRMNDNGRAPACVYESYFNLFLDNIPHDEQQIINKWDEIEKKEPRLKQHNPFIHKYYVRDIGKLHDSSWIADSNLSKGIDKFQIGRLCNVVKEISQIENNTSKS